MEAFEEVRTQTRKPARLHTNWCLRDSHWVRAAEAELSLVTGVSHRPTEKKSTKEKTFLLGWSF